MSLTGVPLNVTYYIKVILCHLLYEKHRGFSPHYIVYLSILFYFCILVDIIISEIYLQKQKLGSIRNRKS